ncbi:MAG: arsenate reductase (glutaredoxin) [Colwellia sp.]
MLTIYHNPRCSKSRQTLALLEQEAKRTAQDFTIIEYLKTPLSQNDIEEILAKLQCKPVEMMRSKEAEFKDKNLKIATDQQLIQAMIATPKLIERPIVSNNETAIIGRPPENVLTLFKQ